MAMQVIVSTVAVEKEILELLTDNPAVAKCLKAAVKKVLNKAAKKTKQDLKTVMDSDPRKAQQAVKIAVYKKLFGGNISILKRKKASNTRVRLNIRRKLDANPHQRGGNRMKRSKRTEEIDSYYGVDRSFILRWLNDGVNRDGNTKSRGDSHLSHPANRGVIKSGNFFEQFADSRLDEALDGLEDEIDAQLQTIIKN